MKKIYCIFVVVLCLASCRPDAQDGTSSTLPITRQYAFVLSGTTYPGLESPGLLSGYSLDKETGLFSPLPNVVIDVEVEGTDMVVDPQDKYLYLVTRSTSKIYGFSISEQTGQLTAVPGSPFSIRPFGFAKDPVAVAIDPSGRYLYVALLNYGAIAGFTLDQSTGTLTPIKGSPFADDFGPQEITLHPSGKYLISINWNSLRSYEIDQQTGVLKTITTSTYKQSEDISSGCLSLDGKYLFINSQQGVILAFAVNGETGDFELIKDNGFPIHSGIGAITPMLSKDGNFMFVANWYSGSLLGYAITPAAAMLTPLAKSPWTKGVAFPTDIAQDGSGRYLYLLNSTISTMNTYKLEADGNLSDVEMPLKTAVYPKSIAIVSSPDE